MKTKAWFVVIAMLMLMPAVVNGASLTISSSLAQSVYYYSGNYGVRDIDLNATRIQNYPYTTYRGIVQFNAQAWYNLGIDESRITGVTLQLSRKSNQGSPTYQVWSMKTANENGSIAANSSYYNSAETLVADNVAYTTSSMTVTSGVLGDLTASRQYTGLVLRLKDETTNGRAVAWDGGSSPKLIIYYNPVSAIWTHINNAKSVFGKSWSSTEIDNLESLFTTSHTDYKPGSDAERWHYADENYASDGFWGSDRNTGNAWTDKYGFKHISLENGKGISTFDQEDQWAYLAKAGYSQEFGELFGEDWSKDEVDALYALYLAGSGSVEIDGETWYYTPNDFSGRTYGDYWVENGKKYIYLGSGLTTDNPVPEPVSVILLGCAVAGMIKRKFSGNK
ncbi:MAG: hypothetical protein AB1454_08025 [Candidatus Auribacterota bacterium]